MFLIRATNKAYKPSLLLKSVCILTWELRSSRIILRWKHVKQFLKYNFFQIVITFESRLHAYLQNKWQEDYLIKETKDLFLHLDFDSMDMFTRVTVVNALLCYCASLHPTLNATQWLPKWLLNSLSLPSWMTCELSTRPFYPERPEKNLETPPQCLQVIDQKWPLVVKLINVDRFSKKWAWHLSNRISCKTFINT